MAATSAAAVLVPGIAARGRTRRRQTAGRRGLAGLLLLLLIAACGDEETSTSAPKPAVESPSATTSAALGPPGGVLAIGHSGLTGESSDPARLGQAAPENSWATGTETAVNSVYRRMLATRPEIAGTAVNRAVGGARASQLSGQAAAGLAELPNPALVIVQTIDNDIRCDGTDAANVKTFGSQLADALSIITDRAPQAKILTVGQIGRPASAVQIFAQLPGEKQKLTGTGVCDMFAPSGAIDPAKVDALTQIIEGYEAEQARVCATVPQCSTDNGVLSNLVDRPEWVVAGHLPQAALAKVAEMIWPTVVELFA